MRKSYRVKSEKDFDRVFHHGKNSSNHQFVVYTLEKEQPHFRVGISVGKRIGNAVCRNQVKRRIRQALSELKPSIKSNVDFIIIARRPVAQMDQVQVKSSLVHVLKRAGLLKSLAISDVAPGREEHLEHKKTV